jgi:hypothetical protein
MFPDKAKSDTENNQDNTKEVSVVTDPSNQGVDTEFVAGMRALDFYISMAFIIIRTEGYNWIMDCFHIADHFHAEHRFQSSIEWAG